VLSLLCNKNKVISIFFQVTIVHEILCTVYSSSLDPQTIFYSFIFELCRSEFSLQFTAYPAWRKALSING